MLQLRDSTMAFKCYYGLERYPMKNTATLIKLTLLALTFNCCQDQKEKTAGNISGLWSLHIMELQDTITGDWNEWRNGMQGYLLYDNYENMALHLTVKGYQDTDLRFPNFTDTISIDALKHLTGSYFYMGRYKVLENEGVVRHTRISHSNPGEWNAVVRRKFSFSGDTLVIQPEESQNAGLRLKWVRK